jgi:uncharacterized protein (DUF2147 family)
MMFGLLLLSSETFANSPVGRWMTFDEQNGDTLAIVEIYNSGANLAGRVEKVFLRPHQGEDGICARCSGERHNQPVIGMKFLWDFVEKAKDWENGRILNPPDGKIYHARMWLKDEHSLKVEASFGPLGLLKHTQTWVRRPGSVSSGSPAGIWEIYDERFDQLSSVVEIEKSNEKLEGRILQTFLMPDEGPEARCVACPDTLHNQKIVGMQILRDLEEEGGKWTNGSILDPANGKTYRCSLWLENADRLKVRGHWGPFTRTQTWHRVRTSGPRIR